VEEEGGYESICVDMGWRKREDESICVDMGWRKRRDMCRYAVSSSANNPMQTTHALLRILLIIVLIILIGHSQFSDKRIIFYKFYKLQHFLKL
jgi:hypothetical protein